MNRNFCALATLAASMNVAPFPASAQDAQVRTAAAAASETECAGAARLGYTQRRIVELATQGIVPLRSFILRTRMIYQLDLTETAAWLDQRRALLATCDQRSARSDPIASALPYRAVPLP